MEDTASFSGVAVACHKRLNQLCALRSVLGTRSPSIQFQTTRTSCMPFVNAHEGKHT